MAACLLKGTSSNPKPLQLDDAKVEIEKTLAIRGSISCEIIGRVWRPLRVFWRTGNQTCRILLAVSSSFMKNEFFR